MEGPLPYFIAMFETVGHHEMIDCSWSSLAAEGLLLQKFDYQIDHEIYMVVQWCFVLFLWDVLVVFWVSKLTMLNLSLRFQLVDPPHPPCAPSGNLPFFMGKHPLFRLDHFQ